MIVRLCCVSVIGLCNILCILQHFVLGGRFSPDTLYVCEFVCSRLAVCASSVTVTCRSSHLNATESVCLQVAKADLSTSDIDRLMAYRQLRVDAVRRVGRRVCQANRRRLKQVSSPPLVGLRLSLNVASTMKHSRTVLLI